MDVPRVCAATTAKNNRWLSGRLPEPWHPIPPTCTCNLRRPPPSCYTMSTDAQIRQAFADVATSSSGQQRAAAAAAAALAADATVLPAAFWECTSHICLLKKRSPGFKRCIQLIQHMATEASATQLNLYLSQCISVHNAKDRHVRLRICEICAGILSVLPLDAEIEYVLYNTVSNARLQPPPLQHPTAHP